MISKDRKRALLEENKDVLDRIQHRYSSRSELSNPVRNGSITTWELTLPNVDDLFAELRFEQHAVSV